MTPDLRHPIAMRGIESSLRDLADSLDAYAESPADVRDIAYSLRSMANSMTRDPEYASIWGFAVVSDEAWIVCDDEQSRCHERCMPQTLGEAIDWALAHAATHDAE